MSAIKKSISLPDGLLEKAVQRQKLFGYTTFSDYIQAVIHADVESGNTEHRRGVYPKIEHRDIVMNDAPDHPPSRKKSPGVAKS